MVHYGDCVIAGIANVLLLASLCLDSNQGLCLPWLLGLGILALFLPVLATTSQSMTGSIPLIFSGLFLWVVIVTMSMEFHKESRRRNGPSQSQCLNARIPSLGLCTIRTAILCCTGLVLCAAGLLYLDNKSMGASLVRADFSN